MHSQAVKGYEVDANMDSSVFSSASDESILSSLGTASLKYLWYLAFLSTEDIGNQNLTEALWHSLINQMNHVLAVKRRTELESQDIKAIRLEICPFKSKRSVLFASIYLPESPNKTDDIKIEANIKMNHSLNLETIFLRYQH